MPDEQPPTRVHECPTCGSPVEVVSSDEGTHHYRPAPSEQPPTRVGKIIGICRNPSEPFYWDADRIGEPCPNACHTFYDDDGEDVPYPHEFYVQVDSAPPSEQPREETQERYIDQWPKPMFLCTHCDEQTDSDPCQECASVFDERGENYPPVLRFQVVPAPAQPEQPREGSYNEQADRVFSEQPREGEARIEVLHPDSTYGRARNRMERESIPTGMDPAQSQPREGTRGEKYEDPYPAANPSLQERGSASGASEQIEPSPNYAGSARSRAGGPAPPRGEGDDLASRLEARADNADKMAAEVARNPSNYGESGPRHHARLLAAAYAFRKAAEMARASTHPEQSGRVENPILSETADHCEYGCEGACESLDHWKDRASYWYEVSESWREQVPGQAPSDLWPASPTPTEARVDPDPLCSVCGHPRSDHDDGKGEAS